MIITYIAWAILLYGYYLMYRDYATLPDQVPLRFNLDGSVQHEGPKSTLYVLLIAGVMVAILMSGLLFSEEAEEAALVLETAHLLIQLLFTYLISQIIRVAKGKENGLGKMFYVLLAGVIILPLVLAFLGK